MACSGKNFDRRTGKDVPCRRIVLASHEDGTEWCLTHDPCGDFAKQNAAFAERSRNSRRADAEERAAAAPTPSASAQRHLTLEQLRTELDRLLPGQLTRPTNNRKLERRAY